MNEFKEKTDVFQKTADSSKELATETSKTANETLSSIDDYLKKAFYPNEKSESTYEQDVTGEELSSTQGEVGGGLLSSFWEFIKKKDLSSDVDKTNPNYELGTEWKINCQRCIPALEMRRRGYDVVAKPRVDAFDRNDLAYDPFSVWKDPEVINCSDDGLSDIEKYMESWGDGARAQIVVTWKSTNSGHTFTAERINGKTVFCDPQNGSMDVSEYFKNVEPGSVQLCRIDNLEVTDKINECCEDRKSSVNGIEAVDTDVKENKTAYEQELGKPQNERSAAGEFGFQNTLSDINVANDHLDISGEDTEMQRKKLMKDLKDAQESLQRNSKRLDELLKDKSEGWIGVDSSISDRKASVAYWNKRIEEINRNLNRLN